jgi:dynein heavy chain
LASEFLEKLVPLIDKEDAHPSIYKMTDQGILPSLTTVLVQEVDRFNKLVKVIKATLMELRRAIAGEVVLSADLEKMYNDFLYGKVPLLWSKVGYPCLKPLSSWYPDFLARMAFLRTWMQNGNPASYWISGFFFPQGFLTGVLQTHSRRFAIPIDEVAFQTHVQTVEHTELHSAADTGVYIHGVYIEGCRWDGDNGSLAESAKAVLYQAMPAVHLDCVHKSEVQASEEIYAAPLYKTSLRQGVLSTTGLSTNHVMNVDLPSLSHDPAHWIHRGVALLCMLND